MIQANELRIGNIFIREIQPSRGLEYEKEFVLTEQWMGRLFGQDDDCLIALQDLSPIPLSPDWLERFGFKINNERDPESCSFDYMHIGLFYIGEFNRSGWLLNAYDSMPPMQYIHQLQNLYFALTGNELSLGPNQ